MANPDLNLLLTLDVLLAEGSVARAARRLRLSPSAMSRALARLRKTTGAWRGKVGAFYNKFRNYIYGAYVDSDGDGVPDHVDDNGALDPSGEFTLISISQARARFAGLEGEVSWRPDPAAG